MKRLYLLLIYSISVLLSFAQCYSEQHLESILDSVSTNPDYVLRWANGAIDSNAKCSDAYFIKAFVYITQEDYLQGLENVNKAIELVTKNSVVKKYELYSFRGLIYETVEDYDLALADYTESIKLNPNETDAYEYRIELYKELMQYENAEQDCRALLAVKDSLAYKLELATILTYQDRIDEALEILNKIIKYQPKQVLPYASRALVNALAGNGQAAISDYISFMTLEGDYSLDYLVSYSAMDYAYAISALTSMVASDKENGIWLSARARVHIAQGEYQAALADIEALESAFGQMPFSLYQASLCYRGLYDYAKQIESLNALVAAMGEDTGSDIYVMRAIAQRNDGNTDAALADFDKALQIDPTSAYALAERGWTKDMLYKDREALKDYNAAITYAEPNAWIYLQRGRMYQAVGDSIKAQTDFEQALQLDTVSSTLAFALFYLGDTDQAIAFMNAIIAENPEDAGEYYNLACLYALANKKQEAVDALKLAIELGYKSYNHIRLDRDLTNIREEQAYQDILNKITKSKISKMFEEIGR